MTQLAAIILAGGRSTRMGQDKALLTVGREAMGDETLLQRTCRIALDCTPQVRVITPWPERYRAMLPEAVGIMVETPLLGHPETFHGPLVAIAQALKHFQPDSGVKTMTPDWIMVLACDLPKLSTPLLQGWIAQLPDINTGTLVCLPQRQGRWEPLCGFYRLDCGPSLWQYSQSGGRALQPWLRQQPVAQLPLPDPALLMNLNTPQDLATWRAQVSTE